ncbi:MAG: AAA family ATPase [Leptonema illini]|uniref:AAA family ATPase n=1 Tax=Leptonema illini TaxID=183 RepID=A0A833H0A7_9LEPT|nr:MAG: AAA family ATPase [Leptonema illini]
MATADQIKSLIRSHYENNPDRFATIALQLAAHEARQGHGGLAEEIRKLVQKSKEKGFKLVPLQREGLDELIVTGESQQRLGQMVLSQDLRKRLDRIIREYRHQGRLKEQGYSNRRKILLSGPPGTGKTLTASAIAGELHLPLYTILMDKMVTRFMGETGARLRQIFNIIQSHRGVYFFDEFDAIGGERGLPNDLGEMRRVLNAFLQFIEQDHSDSFIIAATNNAVLLDRALFRRFDDVITYQLPDDKEILEVMTTYLGTFKVTGGVKALLTHARGLSHADLTRAVDDAVKETILEEKAIVSKQDLLAALKDRRDAYHGKE